MGRHHITKKMAHLRKILQSPNFNKFSLRTNNMPLFCTYGAILEIAALFSEEGVSTSSSE